MAHNDRLTTYDPSQIVMTFGAFTLKGFADGTFINVTRVEDTYKTKVGADGEGARARQLDSSGIVELTLLQTSASNAVLAALHKADEAAPNGTPPLPLLVKDLEGFSLTVAPLAWIMKPPDEGYSKEVGERLWRFASANLRVLSGGN